MYLLGIGSATHPLSPESWDAWFRPTFEYEDLKYVGSFAPIFVHQYSHAWFDFRDKQDKYTDYFANSVIATQAHRLFCIDLASQFKDYGDDYGEFLPRILYEAMSSGVVRPRWDPSMEVWSPEQWQVRFHLCRSTP